MWSQEMWRSTASAFLLTGLVFAVLSGEAISMHAADAPLELVSPYQQYELKLRPFYPVPNRAAGFLLPVRINGGRPLRLVLDSAAEFIVIGTKAGRSLDISTGSEIELVGLGSRTAKVGRAATLEIGPVSFRNCPVALMDRSPSEGADGVIPLSLFSQFLLRFDFPGQTLGLIPYPRQGKTAVPPRHAAAKHNLLLVATVLNEKQSGYVVLDTGAFCSAVSREVARTLSGFPIAPEVTLVAGTGAATGQRVPSAVHFAIAQHDLVPREIVALDLSDLNRHFGVEVVGVLGFPELAHYLLTVDYRAGRVKFEPPQRLSARKLHRGHDVESPSARAFH
jgi:hypothetical protein